MPNPSQKFFLIGCILLGVGFAVYHFAIPINNKETDLLYYPVTITGTNAINCGLSLTICDNTNEVLLCAINSYKEKKAFSAFFNLNNEQAFALASNDKNELFYIHANRNAKDNNEISVSQCQSTLLEAQNNQLKLACLDFSNHKLVEMACSL